MGFRSPLLALTLMGLLTGCGLKTKDVQSASAPALQKQDKDQASPFIDIELTVANSQSIFALTGAETSYQITVDGCVSGYTSSLNEAAPTVKVYKYDRDCLAKLTEVQINGITYRPDPNDPFTTWLAGDRATFQDEFDGDNRVSINVVSQLSDPISGLEEIRYAIEEIQTGEDTNNDRGVVGDTHDLAVNGEPAPAFAIAKVSFNGITARGAGEFVIKFECDEDITGADAATACKGQYFTDLRYKLVADTYDGSLDLPAAQNLFPSDEMLIDVSSEVVAIGDADAGHGGFVSKILTGPARMHNNPNMILVIEAAGTSYRYFNIDVTNL